MVEGKFVIYQLLVRAFGSRECVPGGSFDINGSGKFNDVDEAYLASLKKMSVGAVWFTGVISHATRTAFPGIAPSHPSLVKGEAGSPYAIRDYFDVDPALAVDVERRMDEFCALVERTHRAGMKVIIDFVPNHVAREYDGYFTDEKCLDAMAEHGTVWVPTLAAIDGFIGREGFSSAVTEETLRRQQEAVRRATEKGVMIACGSDSGAVGVPHGAGTLREEELLSAVIDESVWQRGSEEIVRRFRRK